MKHKLFTLLLAVAANVGTIFAWEDNGLVYDLRSENNTAIVICQKYQDADNYSGLTNVIIPNSVTFDGITYRVVGVNYGAFMYCSSLTSVIVGDSISYIDDWAFGECPNLTSVTIGSNVSQLGELAFRLSPNIVSVTINSSSIVSSNHEYYYSDRLTSIFGNQVREYIIGDGITCIGNYLFHSCDSLETVNIPNSVISIGEGAFENCKKLKSIDIPNNVTNIGDWAFASCSCLTSINIPYGVTRLVGTFSECSNLTSVNIPNSVTDIYGAFQHCSNLTSITLPNSIRIIGAYTFYECPNLTDINIPYSVTLIGEEAFSYTDIKSIVIPYYVESIGYQAFANCSHLTSVVWNAAKVIDLKNDHANQGFFFKACPVHSLTIGENVDSLPKLFYNTYWDGLHTVDTLVWKAIDYRYANPISSNECRINNILFGNNVESIPDSLFINYDNIQSIDIPNSVRTIGKMAFCYTNLKSVVIGNGVKTIGANAFDSNYWLTSLIIGKNVTIIEEGAFYNNWNLESATCYAETPPTISSIFDDWRKLDIYVPATSVNAYKKANGWKEHNIYPIGAAPTTTSSITINPSDYSINLTWTSVSGASTYELVVKDKYGNVVLTVTFDANGQLTSIVFRAPAMNNTASSSQDAGFAYTIIGLDSGTEYDITITAKKSGGKVLSTETVSVTTTGESAQALDQISDSKSESHKLVKDGQIFILRGDRTYTLTGVEVK